MHAKTAVTFQAVVLRYLHDVQTGEFLNVGVVLLSREADFFRSRFPEKYSRVTAAFPGAEFVLLRRVQQAFEDLCEAEVERAHELALAPDLDLASILRATLPGDDGGLQLSPILSGLTKDPEATLNEIFERHVGRYSEPTEKRLSRTADEVWQTFAKRQLPPEVLRRFESRKVRSKHLEWTFEHAWKNGRWNAVQPVSLDLIDPTKIRLKASDWVGRFVELRPTEHHMHVALLVGQPGKNRPSDQRRAASAGLEILKDHLGADVEIIPEDGAAELAQRIARDIGEHG